FPQNDLVTIPNIADSARFSPRDMILERRAKNISLEDFVVIFVGQFIDRKGYKKLVEALTHLPDCRAIFIGKGRGPTKSKQIIYSGSVPHDELPTWYACADVFVLPTRSEGCCN